MSKCASLLAHGRAARFRLSPPSCLPVYRSSRYFSSSPLRSSEEKSGPSESVSSQEEEMSDTNSSRLPNLMEPDLLFDSAHTRIYRGRRSRKAAKVNVRNDPSFMVVDKELNDSIKDDGNTELNEEKDSTFMYRQVENTIALHRYSLVMRRVTQQTGKGLKHRQYHLVVVGNGDGLVGYGEGKHEEVSEAGRKAFTEAIRSMDYVDRFEHRTIWTDMSIKLGSTRILMRPRPVGFGLVCNPNIHQVLKAAGIKDVSAKVWGSRNPIQVIKATCMLIQSGNAPLSMGNGIGGKGRRLDAGVGMRGKESVERDRGRKLLDGRTW